MARITVEDCLKRENNRFSLIHLAAQRAKQILLGAKPKIDDTRGNKTVVVALREIAEGQVRFMTPEDQKRADDLRAAREAEAGENGTQPVVVEARNDLMALFGEDTGFPEIEGGDDDEADDEEEDGAAEAEE